MQRALWNRDYRNRADPNLQVPEVIQAPMDLDEEHNGSLESLKPKAKSSEQDWAEAMAASQQNQVAQPTHSATSNDLLADDAAAAAVLQALNSADPATLELPLPTKGLTQARKDKLDSLGFVWCVRMKQFDDQWDEMYQQVSCCNRKELLRRFYVLYRLTSLIWAFCFLAYVTRAAGHLQGEAW